ncbi:MAG: hypothetical protein LBM04_12045, partial [Opitutaceae bacterium]|nr:hypothetical protein [Opitutaceae bacterium]
YWFVGKQHPGGMPEARIMCFWHPSGMLCFLCWVPVVSVALRPQPPDYLWQASGLPRRYR